MARADVTTHESHPIDPKELALALHRFEQALEECTSPLHYGIPVSHERFVRDKADYLARMSEQPPSIDGKDTLPSTPEQNSPEV